jgi:NhaP-type Na+/H+ or K+/H+ antiporter
MAFVGTLISAGIFGGLLYVVVSWGLTLPLSLLECFIFGSLISATDPVSVLGEYRTPHTTHTTRAPHTSLLTSEPRDAHTAIFKDLGVNKNLYASVFGESILNDAIAIVLFRYARSPAR